MGSYEGLSGGLLAAGAALFAGWLAWSAVQRQIEAEETRARADRVEVERVLQDNLDMYAEALGAVWKVLESVIAEKSATDAQALVDQSKKIEAAIGFIAKSLKLKPPSPVRACAVQ